MGKHELELRDQVCPSMTLRQKAAGSEEFHVRYRANVRMCSKTSCGSGAREAPAKRLSETAWAKEELLSLLVITDNLANEIDDARRRASWMNVVAVEARATAGTTSRPDRGTRSP